tara:strand:+ start:805 stop:1014 length:210 start_codon:yes stop_codon:yes gene_type:complete
MSDYDEDEVEAFNQQLDKMWKSGDPDQLAAVAASLMLAMSYWHERAKLHILLHPLFFLAGFITCYFLVK